ncbi:MULTISPECIES: serine protease [unclassified Bradyrhizobium]|uniref:trypsin-like serine peptidase n=1 Tax=unclassified Bradyrhizobium TaxID=2631580 RepID=UPI0028E700E7|nr:MULTISPECIES: serine protease [unclassified Bradyrhizobium]
MALDQRHAFLLDRARRALGHNTPMDAVDKVRSIIGAKDIPNSEAEAQVAMDTLLAGDIPTPAQLAALEIVVRLMRPVVFTEDGILGDLPETKNRDLRPEDLTKAWSAFQTMVRPHIGSIGRIEDSKGRHVGTGFVAGDDLIATNRHVLSVLTTGAEALRPDTCHIVFKYEYNRANSGSDKVPIETVKAIHPTLDVVLLRAPVAGRRALPFSRTQPSAGDRVVTIGYPGKDEDNNPLFMGQVFDGKFGVRRAALGEVLDGSATPNLFHDCSTTQGNSGSPVFLIGDASVAAVHRSGYFMYRNEAVASDELARLLN